jgi:hypothetical protein
MSKVYCGVVNVCWALGLISLVGVLVLKLQPTLQRTLGMTPHGGLIVAAVLFLCVLATGEARKAPPSS